MQLAATNEKAAAAVRDEVNGTEPHLRRGRTCQRREATWDSFARRCVAVALTAGEPLHVR
jgi:hypothetical protein